MARLVGGAEDSGLNPEKRSSRHESHRRAVQQLGRTQSLGLACGASAHPWLKLQFEGRSRCEVGRLDGVKSPETLLVDTLAPWLFGRRVFDSQRATCRAFRQRRVGRS